MNRRTVYVRPWYVVSGIDYLRRNVAGWRDARIEQYRRVSFANLLVTGYGDE